VFAIELKQRSLSALFLVVMQHVVTVSYRRFGTTYRSHPHWITCPLKMGTIGFHET